MSVRFPNLVVVVPELVVLMQRLAVRRLEVATEGALDLNLAQSEGKALLHKFGRTCLFERSDDPMRTESIQILDRTFPPPGVLDDHPLTASA